MLSYLCRSRAAYRRCEYIFKIMHFWILQACCGQAACVRCNCMFKEHAFLDFTSMLWASCMLQAWIHFQKTNISWFPASNILYYMHCYRFGGPIPKPCCCIYICMQVLVNLNCSFMMKLSQVVWIVEGISINICHSCIINESFNLCILSGGWMGGQHTAIVRCFFCYSD